MSVVVPCYNEEGNILQLYKALLPVLPEKCEIIFVNDGSRDATGNRIKELRETDKRVKYILLSKNFGQQNAILAGLVYTTGNCVISMDADLQHPPHLISAMLEKWQQGFDLVTTEREYDGQPNSAKAIASRFFYYLLNAISEIQLKPGQADFALLDRKAVNVLTELHDPDMFIRGYVQWMGFKQTSLKYAPDKRFSGDSKYTFIKMLKLGLSGIVSFSIKPMRIAIGLGIGLFVISFFYALAILFGVIINKEAYNDFKLLLGVILLLTSLQFILLGAIGEYVARNFKLLKKKPAFIVDQMEFD
ncbi:MAG TPA: glycosyltransferase family 2 protein [Chitinophagales bacterium]|nr:glycosyltransferase family 2 protein [Chitinophagales bacterium]